MVNNKDDEDAIAYLKDKGVPSMVNTLIEDILHHRPDQLTLQWLPPTGKATGPRFVLFSSRTPDKEDFKASLAVPSVEYDWNSSSAADLCSVLRNACRFYTGGEGFKSICVACHGPAQAVSGAFVWQVTADVVLTSPKQLEDDADPATLFFKQLGRSTISGGRVDLLACNLLQTQAGRDVFHKIEQVTRCNFAASEDVTGNVTSNANWVMESDGVDISKMYFGNLKQFDGTFGTMAVSEDELIKWINDLLQAGYTSVAQLSTGAAYCQVMDMLFANAMPLQRVIFQAEAVPEYIKNWKLLQTCMKKAGVDKSIPVDKLIKFESQVNLEFLQWFKSFFDANYGGPDTEYDPLAKRGGVPLGP